jgi:hypothetical protein
VSDTMGSTESGASGSESFDTGLESGGAEAIEPTSTPAEDVVATEVSSGQESSADSPSYLFEHEGEGITLDAAREGFLRQADYTRKTQEVAAQRKELQRLEALDVFLRQDPQRAIELLAEQHNVDLGEYGKEFLAREDETPEQRELRELRAQVAKQDQSANQQAIQSEFAQLREEFGDVDDLAVLTHAAERGFPSLRAAYVDLNLDSVIAQRVAAEKAKAEEDARIEAKRGAQVVEGSSSRAGSAPKAPARYESMMDSFLAAKKTVLGG